jgi:hypothetical protein
MTRLAPQWADARTLDDLGRLTALWLEGAILTQPGYSGRPDTETATLTPTLAAANRAGYVTYSSQPGFDGTGYDGARWQQRPAVEGLVGDEPAAVRLVVAAEAAGFQVVAQAASRWRCRQATAVTVTRSGLLPSVWLPRTGFGVQLSRRELAFMFEGCGRDAVRAAQAAWQVTLIDPRWGPGGRLWDLLDGWAGR